jgi:hypothetical protein
MYGLKKYFQKKSEESILHKAVKKGYSGCTTLNLKTERTKMEPRGCSSKNPSMEAEKPTWAIPCRIRSGRSG